MEDDAFIQTKSQVPLSQTLFHVRPQATVIFIFESETTTVLLALCLCSVFEMLLARSLRLNSCGAAAVTERERSEIYTQNKARQSSV